MSANPISNASDFLVVLRRGWLNLIPSTSFGEFLNSGECLECSGTSCFASISQYVLGEGFWDLHSNDTVAYS